MTRKFFEYGGWIAGAVLIVFGIGAITMGVNGRNEVRDSLAAQKITAGDGPKSGCDRRRVRRFACLVKVLGQCFGVVCSFGYQGARHPSVRSSGSSPCARPWPTSRTSGSTRSPGPMSR